MALNEQWGTLLTTYDVVFHGIRNFHLEITPPTLTTPELPETLTISHFDDYAISSSNHPGPYRAHLRYHSLHRIFPDFISTTNHSFQCIAACEWDKTKAEPSKMLIIGVKEDIQPSTSAEIDGKYLDVGINCVEGISDDNNHQFLFLDISLMPAKGARKGAYGWAKRRIQDDEPAILSLREQTKLEAYTKLLFKRPPRARPSPPSSSQLPTPASSSSPLSLPPTSIPQTMETITSIPKSPTPAPKKPRRPAVRPHSSKEPKPPAQHHAGPGQPPDRVTKRAPAKPRGPKNNTSKTVPTKASSGSKVPQPKTDTPTESAINPPSPPQAP